MQMMIDDTTPAIDIEITPARDNETRAQRRRREGIPIVSLVIALAQELEYEPSEPQELSDMTIEEMIWED